ncbi:MAG: DUF5752 family protein [Candidatus Altiarchaeota archaeon]
MKAVILAGGLGTRLRPLTFTRPKPMIPLLNKPVTQHIIDYLKAHNIDEVIITTNYMREYIQQFFGEGEDQGLKLHYPAEESPLGTAGSVKNIAHMLKETFVVIQGDNITDINLSELIKSHKQRGALCSVALLAVDDPSHYGIADLGDDGRIRRFHEKPGPDDCFSNLANIGVYVLEPEVLEFIPEDSFFDFSRDLFPVLVEKESLYGLETKGFWVDVGQPEGYNKARDWLMTKVSNRFGENIDIGSEFDGPLVIGDNSRVSGNTKILGPVVIGKNVFIEEGCILGPNTIIGDNVVIKKDSELYGSVVFEENTLGVNSNLYDCVLAESCNIGQASKIGFNVVVGSNCDLGQRVSVVNDSRIWPNQAISDDSVVNGTLKRFIQMHSVRRDPDWSLRVVSPEEAFYFNLSQNHNVLYTGFKAKSLEQFSHILERVDLPSIDYHLREDQNDFRDWLKGVLCDYHLASVFDEVKLKGFSGDLLRKALVNNTKSQINRLTKIVDSKKAYI